MTLDDAWAAAEASLPDGACDLAVYHYDDGPAASGSAPHKEPSKYAAKTYLHPDGREVYGYGLSPADALVALAVRLEGIA